MPPSSPSQPVSSDAVSKATPRPPTVSATSPTVLRDSIWYETRGAGEWLKTREPEEAMAKIRRLLELTTFSGWKEVRLEVHVPTSAAMAQLYDYLQKPKGKVDLYRWREQALDHATLAAHQVEVDELFAEGLRRFGGARLRLWSSMHDRDWREHRYLFWWDATRELPAEWFSFCCRHRAAMMNERPRAALTLRVDELAWIDPATGVPLPYQGDEHYPSRDNAPSWPTYSSLTVHLPQCRMTLDARLPFDCDGAELREFRRQFRDAVGYELETKRLRVLLVNDEGTGAYTRVQLPKKARPPRGIQPGAQERRERRAARRRAMF
jgi:hypothetical protein